MQKYEIHSRYLAILANPDKFSFTEIDRVKDDFDKQIADYKKDRENELKMFCADKTRYNQAMADETRILLEAFLDDDNHMHPFSVEYIKALQAAEEVKKAQKQADNTAKATIKSRKVM